MGEPGPRVRDPRPQLHIATGARLAVEQADLWITGTTTVSGALTLHRSMLVGWIDVSEDAWLSMVNSWGGAWASDLAPPVTDAWITNRGTVVLRFNAFDRFDIGPGSSMGAAFVHTLDGGTTIVGATIFEPYGLTSPDCLGTPPLSEGYNRAQGCGFDGPGDIDDGSHSGTLADVPPGVAGCGTTVTVDRYGDPRPNPASLRPDHCTRGVSE